MITFFTGSSSVNSSGTSPAATASVPQTAVSRDLYYHPPPLPPPTSTVAQVSSPRDKPPTGPLTGRHHHITQHHTYTGSVIKHLQFPWHFVT